jgi:ABC-type transport system involved in cytochrome bd biosynthesis fused ATPase/permease subunit
MDYLCRHQQFELMSLFEFTSKTFTDFGKKDKPVKYFMNTETYQHPSFVGPGGSGKSCVLNLLVRYAKEYCIYLNVPFTKQTIVMTAMSGVAASMIGGNTAHSALCVC